MFEGLSSSGSDCPSEPSASGPSESGLRAKARIPSPKKLRLGSGEGDPTAASSKGKDKAGSGEGDPTAASSKGTDKAPTLDDMLSDDPGDGSSRASSDFSTVSEAQGFQDVDLAPPLSKRSNIGFGRAQSWQSTMTERADRLELEGDKRAKFKNMLQNDKRSKKRASRRMGHNRFIGRSVDSLQPGQAPARRHGGPRIQATEAQT